MSWSARFQDGPCVETVRVFVVGSVWERMLLAPMPSELRGEHYVIVGGDGIGPREPGEEPWPGEVSYRLVETHASPDPLVDVVAWYALGDGEQAQQEQHYDHEHDDVTEQG